jgi:Flp pilus assembly protein TadB
MLEREKEFWQYLLDKSKRKRRNIFFKMIWNVLTLWIALCLLALLMYEFLYILAFFDFIFIGICFYNMFINWKELKKQHQAQKDMQRMLGNFDG